jgi:hypothetical protein
LLAKAALWHLALTGHYIAKAAVRRLLVGKSRRAAHGGFIFLFANITNY